MQDAQGQKQNNENWSKNLQTAWFSSSFCKKTLKYFDESYWTLVCKRLNSFCQASAKIDHFRSWLPKYRIKTWENIFKLPKNTPFQVQFSLETYGKKAWPWAKYNKLELCYALIKYFSFLDVSSRIPDWKFTKYLQIAPPYSFFS